MMHTLALPALTSFVVAVLVNLLARRWSHSTRDVVRGRDGVEVVVEARVRRLTFWQWLNIGPRRVARGGRHASAAEINAALCRPDWAAEVLDSREGK